MTFTEAQQQLSVYLARKLTGEKMNEALTKRAQKLADKWFKEREPVVIAKAGIQVCGAVLGFGLGTIKVAKWKTCFTADHCDLAHAVPNHVALGYVNGYQLYIADVEDVPHLCARRTPTDVLRWSVKQGMIPDQTSPLFVALERARMLGYLDHLKGIK